MWPSSLKFMSELNHEAKALLECALMEANRERENAISTPSPLESDQWSDNLSEVNLCSHVEYLFCYRTQ